MKVDHEGCPQVKQAGKVLVKCVDKVDSIYESYERVDKVDSHYESSKNVDKVAFKNINMVAKESKSSAGKSYEYISKNIYEYADIKNYNTLVFYNKPIKPDVTNFHDNDAEMLFEDNFYGTGDGCIENFAENFDESLTSNPIIDSPSTNYIPDSQSLTRDHSDLSNLSHQTHSNDVSNSSDVDDDLGRRTRLIIEPIYSVSELQAMFLEHREQEFDNGQNCEHEMQFVRFHKNGLYTRLLYACNVCGYDRWIDSEQTNDNVMGINDCAVIGTLTAGTGFSSKEEELAAMNISFMSNKNFIDQRLGLVPTIEKACAEQLTRNAREEYAIAIKQEHFIIYQDEKYAIIAVKIDGVWNIRSYHMGSYSSSAGMAFICGDQTGKVLYVGYKGKYCAKCAFYQRKGLEVPSHPCFKNWTGSASSMETAIILEGFQRSMDDHKLIYKEVIGDRDASVYTTLVDNRVYEQVDVELEKIDCTNHLFRNFCNNITSISQSKINNNNSLE